MRALVLCLFLSCCLLPATDPDDLVSKCQAEARAAHYVGHKSVEESLRIYDACILRGL